VAREARRRSVGVAFPASASGDPAARPEAAMMFPALAAAIARAASFNGRLPAAHGLTG